MEVPLYIPTNKKLKSTKNYHNHGGESRDILYLYSDRTGKKIPHYFYNTQ